MNVPYGLREFLRTFPTTFEYEDGDTGFFVDPVKRELLFLREGRTVARISVDDLYPDPEGAFENWRRRFAGTVEWRPGRGRDD